MTGRFSTVLTKGKKNSWPTLSLNITAYTVRNFKEVEAKAEEIKGFHFPPLTHRSYDPERIIPAHCKKAKFKWNYQHTECSVEDKTNNWYNKDSEVVLEESIDQ